MPLVLDASVTACWLLPDETDPVADAAFSRLPRDPGLVPAHWWFEVRNVFLVAERRGRASATVISNSLTLLGKLPITIRTDVDQNGILRLARAHRLSFYDAAYLDLAKRCAVPLATLDRDLVAAARTERVPLVGVDV